MAVIRYTIALYGSICQQPHLNRNTNYVWEVGEDLLKKQIFEWVPLDDQEPKGQVLIGGKENLDADSNALVHTSSPPSPLNCDKIHVQFSILNIFKCAVW